LLAGAFDAILVQHLKELGFRFEIAGPDPGNAAAAKMVRSLFVKGLEAITVETLLAAAASGCLDLVLNSLTRSYPGLDLMNLASYHLDRTLKHGKRRGAEMLESAATLDELGLHGELARSIATVQQMMGSLPYPPLPRSQLQTVLPELVALRRSLRVERACHDPKEVEISS
jgi:3-hydroxyisobutyrate dehydrogenase-like beta-hydroxyacid dehydrogenase